MTSYLATIGNVKDIGENLRAARADVGSGGASGDTYLKVDKHNGDLTFGVENAPLPEGMRFVVGLHDIAHGYLVSSPDKKIVERHMVPMAQGGTRPVPPGGQYGTFEGGGPRNATEIGLSSIDEPGFRLVFTAWGPSSANRIGNVLDKAITHLGSADGQAGFIHPVVLIKSGSYEHKTYGTIHHIDFDPVDWLHGDGKTLLSERSSEALAAPPDGPAPWEDDDEMTDAERELLETT